MRGRERLAAFVDAVSADIGRRDDREVALAVRGLVSEALADERFVLDVVDVASAAMVPAIAQWDNPPIVDDEALEYSMRIIYWPAGTSNQPHRHTCWTVTGVLWNELIFSTYKPSAGDRPPAAIDQRFHGRRGDVGFIVPPCIHSVANPSTASSLSLHVFSGPKTEAAGSHERGRTTWFGRVPDVTRGESRPASEIVEPLAELLGAVRDPGAVPILERLFDVGDLGSRLACVKALSRHDAVLAGHRLLEVTADCGPQDRGPLQRLASTLIGGGR